MSHLRDSMDTPFATLTDLGDQTNPKDLIGARKVAITLLPPTATLHFAHAMMDGAKKYGPYNWRQKKVQANIYIDAAIRHLLLWAAGEEYADDSGIHHLGHAGACFAILLDAQATGNLIDNRFKNEAFIKILKDLNKELSDAILPSA